MEREFELVLTVEKDPKLIVYCGNCDKVLYETEDVNEITLLVCDNTAHGHSLAFTPEHEVVIINLSEGDNGN